MSNNLFHQRYKAVLGARHFFCSRHRDVRHFLNNLAVISAKIFTPSRHRGTAPLNFSATAWNWPRWRRCQGVRGGGRKSKLNATYWAIAYNLKHKKHKFEESGGDWHRSRIILYYTPSICSFFLTIKHSWAQFWARETWVRRVETRDVRHETGDVRQ